MTELLRPAAEWELQTVIAKLAAQKTPVEIVGHGALRNVGRPSSANIVIVDRVAAWRDAV